MKRSMSVLLLCLITSIALAAPPSDERIAEVYETNPESIYNMVRKLYIVERATPDILLPTVVIAELKTGEAVVEFQGPLVIDIGNGEASLQYSAQVEAVDATIADPPPPRIGPGWVVAGGLLVFIGGAVTGALVFR